MDLTTLLKAKPEDYDEIIAGLEDFSLFVDMVKLCEANILFLQRFLKRGVPENVLHSALRHATGANNLPVVKILIEAGAPTFNVFHFLHVNSSKELFDFLVEGDFLHENGDVLSLFFRKKLTDFSLRLINLNVELQHNHLIDCIRYNPDPRLLDVLIPYYRYKSHAYIGHACSCNSRLIKARR